MFLINCSRESSADLFARGGVDEDCEVAGLNADVHAILGQALRQDRNLHPCLLKGEASMQLAHSFQSIQTAQRGEAEPVSGRIGGGTWPEALAWHLEQGGLMCLAQWSFPAPIANY